MEFAYSKLVKAIIQSSGKVAVRFNNECVEAQHLLLAIIDESLRKPIEAEVILKTLKILNVNLFELIGDIENSIDDGELSELRNNIPLSRKTEKILKVTVLEAKISHSDTIEVEHVFLSYLRGQPDFYRKTLIPKYGLRYGAVRDTIERIIL